MDVVLSPELSGIAAHESVGHPQEADRILGREGAQAGESYLSRDSLGMKVGSEEANVSDDPTLAHSNGYSPVDDEGVASKKRRLIVDGKITEFLQNRSTSSLLGVKNNGSSRSSGFDREPIIRMSNTFVEPGDYATTEELIKEVKDGIYLKSFTEWNIDDKRLNQRYTGLEAYRIKNGETTSAREGAHPRDHHAGPVGEREGEEQAARVRGRELREGRPDAGHPRLDGRARHPARGRQDSRRGLGDGKD